MVSRKEVGCCCSGWGRRTEKSKSPEVEFCTPLFGDRSAATTPAPTMGLVSATAGANLNISHHIIHYHPPARSICYMARWPLLARYIHCSPPGYWYNWYNEGIRAMTPALPPMSHTGRFRAQIALELVCNYRWR